MKRLLILVLLLNLTTPVYAGDGWHYVRKTLWLPVYMCFAQPVAFICWWKVADEKKIIMVIDK